MYDPSLTFIREIESYCVRNSLPNNAISLHFCVYKESAEHQSFLSAVRKESKSFEMLIETKGRLVISVNETEEPSSPEVPMLDTRNGEMDIFLGCHVSVS